MRANNLEVGEFMKEWTRAIEINAPIEKVWSLVDGSLKNMQKIMPNVIEHTPISVTEEKVGSIYRQKYKEGKRIAEYDVKTLDYLDTPDKKRLKVGFTLANMFEITALYDIVKIAEDKTSFTYTVTNHPLKWFVKIFLFFATDKSVIEFLERVKNIAEENVNN